MVSQCRYKTLGGHPQDEEFTRHDVWDFASTPAEKYSVLLSYPYFEGDG